MRQFTGLSLSGLYDTFFQTQGDMAPAQKLGAPLIPLGLGAVAVAALFKTPKWVTPVGIGMSVAGIALLLLAKKKQDDALSAHGITTSVSGPTFGNPFPAWQWDTGAGGWVPGT